MLAEATLQQLHHDGRGNGRARGCAEQTGDAALRVVDQGGAELEGTELRGTRRLDHLDALACHDSLPVGRICARDVLLEGLDALVKVLEHLGDQVLGQAELLRGNAQVGGEVVRADGLEQVQVGALLQELRGPATVRTKEQAFLAVDDAGIQVRHGHRRGADGSLAVNLGVVALDQLRVLGAQPQAGDREARETGDLAHACLAQQVERVAARTDEDELGVHGGVVTGVQVLGHHAPLGAVALDVHDLVSIADLGAGCLGRGEELLGECTEVDVSTGIGPGDGDLLGGEVTALRHERQLLLEGGVIIAELHVREHVVVLQRIEATLEVIHLDGALREGDVRHRVDEGARVRQDAVVELVGPELAGDLELLIDVHCLRDINAAVLFRGVVQLAQCGVTGTSVVPRGGGFQRRAIETLEDHLRPAGFELTQHSAQGGAHDAGTDEGNLDLVYYLCCLLVGGHCIYYLFESISSMWSFAPSHCRQCRVRCGALGSSAGSRSYRTIKH